MKSSQKRANGKNKAIVTLCIALAVTILLGVISFTGLSFLNVPRWMPTASTDPEKWPDSLPLGLDLRGGVYVEFTGSVPEGTEAGFDELAEGTMRIIRDRLANVGQTEATVQKIGTNGIRVEVPMKQDQSTAAQVASQQADIQVEAPQEETVPEETVPEETPADGTSEETAETAPAETEAEVTADAETAPAETEAETTADAETAPTETEAEAIAETEAAPAETEAEATADAETAPAETEAEATAEAEAAPAEAAKTSSAGGVIQEVLDLIGEPAVMRFVDPNGNVFMTGDMVKSARYVAVSSPKAGSSQHQVEFKLTDEGAKIFGEYTTTYNGQVISIYLDETPLVQAVVNEPILDGTGLISGQYTQQEAQAVAAKIQSGALPLILTRDKVDVVSATLGQDALSTSVTAALIGILLIMALMIFRYRLNGVIASWALTIYVILLFGMIALFKVQLTLPGLAGVVLGIGMAVDANVIIFERFNEEARKGRSAKASVRAGFKNAISAILDANVTTLIAAIVLLIFGTGSIQGFARTLLLGVVVSMITAVLVTRFLMNRFVDAGATEVSLFAKVKAEEEVAQ